MSAPPASIESGTAQPDWDAIESLLEELTVVARSPVSPAEFYRRLINPLVAALGLRGGGVWVRNDEAFSLAYELNLRGSEGSSPKAAASHRFAARQVLDAGEARVWPPRAVDPNAANENETDCWLVCHPFLAAPGTLGVIELVEPRTVSGPLGRQYLRILSAVSEVAEDFHRNSELRRLQDREQHWRRYEQFTQAVHRGLNVRNGATVIANDARGIIDCDRVSVLLARGKRARAMAISGVDILDRRSKLVQKLERFAAMVVRVAEPVWLRDGMADLPPQVEAPLDEYLDEGHARALAAVPLFEPQANPGKPRRVIGVLVAEWLRAPATDDGARETVTLVSEHGGAALANALQYERLPLSTVGRSLAAVLDQFEPARLPRSLMILGGTVATVAALCLVPADFTIEAPGELLPARRQHVFASESGMVSQLLTDHGQAVKAGAPLVELRKPEIDLQLRRVGGEIQTVETRLAAIRAERLENLPAAPDGRKNSLQLAADEEEFKEQLKSLRQQQEVLTRQRDDLVVRSPMDGETLTWNLREQLEARPVERGQTLLTVGDVVGPWVVELKIPDRRAGHVLAARHELDPILDVSFILTAEPGTVYSGHLAEMANTTELDEANEPHVAARVTFDREALSTLRSGAAVTARIHCGRRALGYVWLHDLFELVQSKWW